MANSDYIKNGKGAFASVVAWPAGLGHLDTEIVFDAANLATPILSGMVGMCDDEIMRIDTVFGNTLTVKRGCADSIPAVHAAGAVLWVFDVSSMGTDGVERSASEWIGVKVSPYTTAGSVDIATVAPDTVAFDWRFVRPYLPGQLRVNTTRWFASPGMDEETPMLHFTWAHRDRVLQADQLVGHDDAPIGPEPGTTYAVRFYTGSGDETKVREEIGIVGNEFTYPRAHAMHDFGNPADNTTGYFTVNCNRDGADSYTYYFGSFTMVPGGETEVEYLPFAQQVMEAPYIVNLQTFAPAQEGQFVVGMAARPADRSVQTYDLWSNNVISEQFTKQVASKMFTPWITTDFRLPELETNVTVRSSSLYDGVRVDGFPVAVGQLALIGSELVEITYATDKQFVIRRGCADTIPQVHIAGTRMWLFGARAAHDHYERIGALNLDFRFAPYVYSDDLDPAAMPQHLLQLQGRAARPYAPGRVMVNNRPWFEEASALAGLPTVFSWTRRNRLVQGSMIVGHDAPDFGLEAGQITRIHFYYWLSNENGPYIVTLREVDLEGMVYHYSYVDAVADGAVAGQATGVCGTVVIFARIYSVCDGEGSWQSYTAPIRVPSYPCV